MTGLTLALGAELDRDLNPLLPRLGVIRRYRWATVVSEVEELPAEVFSALVVLDAGLTEFSAGAGVEVDLQLHRARACGCSKPCCQKGATVC